MIVSMGVNERNASGVVAPGDSLADEGRAFAERIATVLADGSRVRYYSEGLPRHLL